MGEELEEGEIPHEEYNLDDPYIDKDEYINETAYPMNFVEYVEYYDLMRDDESKYKEF